MQLVYSSGRLIDALLGGAAQNYLEFKLLQQRCACHLSMSCFGLPEAFTTHQSSCLETPDGS